jgi:hypothetical protein
MATELSEALSRAVNEHGGRPVEVVDPHTKRVYVLVSREHFERLKPLFAEDPPTLQEQRELLRQAGKRAGWDDPAMDVYDDYDMHQGQRE